MAWAVQSHSTHCPSPFYEVLKAWELSDLSSQTGFGQFLTELVIRYLFFQTLVTCMLVLFVGGFCVWFFLKKRELGEDYVILFYYL